MANILYVKERSPRTVIEHSTLYAELNIQLRQGIPIYHMMQITTTIHMVSATRRKNHTDSNQIAPTNATAHTVIKITEH
jgi:hypothetical protein